ncbi:hypothetical protein [Billgrantia kenyensis]|uniref:Uncharacterized protein n=1 Tax=Billgrantia kenyensis TaxID=321266 RepID=A0A7V9W0S1_9GAMM|nr:hypothetical protein [Halomonas kenyensis]MBA2778953.1 hypothetical protein [Halomonas kenyensis]MCG6662880.1 hypothetical protein [Halomonas kenyensis]
MSVIKGFMWCLALLFAQLVLLRYVDLRVAAMQRLQDSPLQSGEASVATDVAPVERQGELDA